VDKETARIEAFSDGIFAFAITLLVLELKVPHGLPGGERLLEELLKEWPSYFGYLTSFFTIGIMWVNHHRMFSLIRKSDDGLMLANLAFLLGITFVPFPTAVLAEYFDTPACRIAAAFYTGTYFFMALLFNLLWRYATRSGRLLGPQADRAQVDAITRAYSFGPLMYAGMFAVSLWRPGVGVGLAFAYAAYWAFFTSRG